VVAVGVDAEGGADAEVETIDSPMIETETDIMIEGVFAVTVGAMTDIAAATTDIIAAIDTTAGVLPLGGGTLAAAGMIEGGTRIAAGETTSTFMTPRKSPIVHPLLQKSSTFEKDIDL